jgi:YlmC/YmxH family sporulation protein
MLNTDSIKNKEVINICDGKSMGYVCDIEINLKEGRIDGIVIPKQRGLFSIFGKESDEFVIKWKDVRTVGDDVILVEVPITLDTNC